MKQSKALKKYKAQQNKLTNRRLMSTTYPNDLTIVAEGDSWFDYPLKKDVLDYLIEDGYAVERFSKYGDTLENMVYGSKVGKKKGRVYHKGPESQQQVHNAIKKYKPTFFLLSAGGNDIVGSEIASYLNHKYSRPVSLLNRVIFEERLTQMRNAIETYIKGIRRVSKKCHILMDGYDYAKVSGTGYKLVGVKVAGPWIKPAMSSKGILARKRQQDIVSDLVDGFNEILSDLAEKYSYFHHVDIRNQFPNDSDWHNEIHLNNRAYKKLSNIYTAKMTDILNYNPVYEHKDLIIV